jgi:hypothetical protein
MSFLKNHRDAKKFLMSLRTTKEFWILILSLIVGLVVAGWFVSRVVPTSAAALIVGLTHAFIAGLFFILVFSYRASKSKLSDNSNGRSTAEHAAAVKRELIAGIPLFLGAVTEFYFIVTGRFVYIAPVGFLFLLLWLAFRFVLSRTVGKPGSGKRVGSQ